MKKVYICSPYRAKDGSESDRNIEYAQELTRTALLNNLAPVTPHLYMTQCLDDNDQTERETGLNAGIELLTMCDFVIAGRRYGISDGMRSEIQKAIKAGIDVVDADSLEYYLPEWKRIRSHVTP